MESNRELDDIVPDPPPVILADPDAEIIRLALGRWSRESDIARAAAKRTFPPRRTGDWGQRERTGDWMPRFRNIELIARAVESARSRLASLGCDDQAEKLALLWGGNHLDEVRTALARTLFIIDSRSSRTQASAGSRDRAHAPRPAEGHDSAPTLEEFRSLLTEIEVRARSVTHDSDFPHLDALADKTERLAYRLRLPVPPLQRIWYQRRPDGAPDTIQYDPGSDDYAKAMAERVREPADSGLAYWMSINNCRNYYRETGAAINRILERVRSEQRERTAAEKAELDALNATMGDLINRLDRLNLQRISPADEARLSESAHPAYCDVRGWRLYDPTDGSAFRDILVSWTVAPLRGDIDPTSTPWDVPGLSAQRARVRECMGQWLRDIDSRIAAAGRGAVHEPARGAWPATPFAQAEVAKVDAPPADPTPKPRSPRDASTMPTDTELECIAAMHELGAVDRGRRCTGDEIARKAIGLNADANAVKRQLASLKSKDLVDSVRGSKGGSWLTSKGRRAASRKRR